MDLIVTIVRHGNTFETGAPTRRIGARTDVPLVANGIAQADALGIAFIQQGLFFDRALVAPLQRTRTTAEHILEHQSKSLTIETVDWLTEIDHGPDEGESEDCVIARVGCDMLAAWDTEACVPDGWIVDTESRITGWRTLWETGRGHVLIVTSNGAARFALLSDAALRRQSAELHSLKLRTGAYGVISREQDALRLVTWDQRP